nr:DUF2497 domain-containing protein [Marinicella sp. W31]MDC2877408.1 DUF2497 domain-containing protein [Marinicella sp. W31]
MEEILASIRRIIDSGEDAGRSPVSRAQPRSTGDARETANVSEAADSRQKTDDDRYRYSETVNEPVIVSRRHSVDESESSVPQERSPAAPEPAVEQQVYGAHDTDVRPAEETSSEETFDQGMFAEDRAAEDEDAAVQPPYQAVYPGTMGEVARQVREATGTAPESKEEDNDDEALLSDVSEMRISAALRELSVALEREGARSIEEIVAEELRPLLSDWLEAHMPNIVENVVAREMERMRNNKR